MVGLDTTKIKIPIMGLNGINWGNFPQERIETDRGIETKNINYADKLDYGVNRIQIDNLRDEVIVDLSAKVLKDNYKQSISLNTLEQLTKEINSHDLIDVSSDALMDSLVLRCDPVDTIQVDSIDRSIRSILQYSNMNSKYEVESYLVKGSLGYSVNRKVKSYKERQIGYSKLHDLNKDKHNREFAKQYPNMVSSFDPNDLRIETNMVSFKQIKSRFAVPQNTLGAILNSTKQVNYDIFERVIDTGVQMELFSDYYLHMDMTNLVKEYGYGQIFKQFEYDWVRVETWIKLKYPRTKKKNSAYYQIKKFKEAFKRLNKTEKQVNSDVEQIRELLKVA